MKSTGTTTAGLFRPNLNNARTSHLLPEIHLRSKRMLEQARQETIAANNSVVQVLVEIWRAKTNGATCSCTKESIDSTVERKESGYLNLKDFLLNNDIRPAKITESCSICYGTGLIGGYDLYGCQTTVLESTSRPKLKNASIMRERPYWIKTTGNSEITWLTTIPKYIEDIYGVCIKWNVEPKKWSLYIEEEPLTKETLLLYSGQRVSITLKVKDKTTKDAGLFAIFLHYKIGDILINVDAPLWTKSYTGTLRVWNEVLDNLTANFDSRITRLTSQDIFVFPEGYIYRIVEVQENRPLDVTISWNCQANLVRPTAWYYHVPSKRVLSLYEIKNVSFVV